MVIWKEFLQIIRKYKYMWKEKLKCDYCADVYQNTGVRCHALQQGIFPTQGSNRGLAHCRWIFYHLSHQGSSRILESVAYPISRRSSIARNRNRVSCIAGGFFTSWTTMEALLPYKNSLKQLETIDLDISCLFHLFLPESVFPSGSFHKPLILIHQRVCRMKTTITEN